MNICIFGNSFLPAVGGKEFVMHYLGEALSERGHDVTIVAQRISWSGQKQGHAYNLNRYSLPIKGSGKSGLDFLSAILTVSILNKKKNFDVMNCHGVDYAGTRARVLSKLWKLPLVLTPHGKDIQKIPDIAYGLRLDDAWNRRITVNLKAADYVTAISGSVRQDLDLIAEKYIVDIPNGIDTVRFAGPRSAYLHSLLGIKNDTCIILSVGRNHIKKGYDYGIKAVSKLVQDLGYKGVHYVIVGRGVTAHRSTVAECQAENFVSLIDEMPPEKITQCYKSADIFFSPSIVEGLSLVSIEAMASGLPLVVTDVPGNDDVVRDNGCGVIVKSKDAEAMAAGLYRLLSDDSYRESLAELSRQCSGKYDWSNIAMQYEAVYRRAIYDHNKTEATRA
jgi:glycosyltransferase involved in cell wall biosynthesis